ncbi:hypothetical protein CDAR_178871 [Caerostris darwini]|uniref:Secreted protein n=1 Tax=Caerostris darwini TaxID=1538125 RepID=A0AAV4PGW0_9ARAC|nr:hypothetical protein CDAR_178731 [Caerostris darwini]GIX95159.1 hypothetical protein CDAR_178871 [Caerostris darwini]
MQKTASVEDTTRRKQERVLFCFLFFPAAFPRRVCANVKYPSGMEEELLFRPKKHSWAAASWPRRCNALLKIMGEKGVGEIYGKEQ